MKITIGLRTRPSHKNCKCNDYPVYKFKWIPTQTLWGFNTREWTWLFWSLLVTGLNKN